MIKNHKFITPQILLVIIFTQLLVIFSNLPLIVRINRTPRDRVNSLAHFDNTHDYDVYLSAITLGKNGYLWYRSAFQPDPPQDSIVYSYYILAGRLGAVFDWEPQVIYHVFRIIALESYIISLFYLCRTFLHKPWQLIGVIICLLAETAPPLFFSTGLSGSPGITWWTSFMALERLNAFPHYLIGQSLLFVSIDLIYNFYKNEKFIFALLACIAAFAGSWFFTPVALVIIISLGMLISSIAFNNIIRRNLRTRFKLLLGLSAIAICAGLAMSLFIWQDLRGPHRDLVRLPELVMWNIRETNFNRDSLLLYGILPFLAIPALIRGLYRRKIAEILLAAWAFIPLGLVFFANQLNIPKLRVIQTAPLIPMAVLMTETVEWVSRQKYLWRLVVILFLITSIPVTVKYFIFRVNTISHEPYVYEGIYIPKPIYESTKFINTHIPKDAIILTYEFAGNTLPAFSPVRIYFGHMIQTENFDWKRVQVANFYSRKWNDKEAQGFLDANNISYVYYSSHEQEISSPAFPYGFLKSVYDRNGVKIYKYK